MNNPNATQEFLDTIPDDSSNSVCYLIANHPNSSNMTRLKFLEYTFLRGDGYMESERFKARLYS